MRNRIAESENIIRGSCPLFACGCCRTKYGWEHQAWCEARSLTQPTCRDCLYNNIRQETCEHPVKKREGRSSI